MRFLRLLLLYGLVLSLLAAVLGCGRSEIDSDGARSTGGGAAGGGGGSGGGIPCDPESCPPASSQCVEHVCNDDGSCGEVSTLDGTPCDDGNACTQADACEAGACIGENPVICTEMDDCHAAGVCDPTTGACSSPPVADGTLCDDGDACTQTDVCQSGLCVGGNPMVCSAIDQCHDAGVCDHGTGACSNPNKADGSACDDGDACTQADVCQSGSCSAGSPVVCGLWQSCSAGMCVEDPITYIKESNTDGGDNLGVTMAISADGNTLAVGAGGEDSSATGVNGDQSDNSASGSGAVYIFVRNGSVWSQQAYIKASNTGFNDGFAWSLALSADGNTLAVGAVREASGATGINGDQADNSANDAGAAYVFVRSGTVWSQQAYIKASNTNLGDNFGQAVALSATGDTLAVSASWESGGATGINGDQTDNSAPTAGAVYVYVRSAGSWTQQAYVKASNTNAHDVFGEAVALSGDGNTLAVGAEGEASNATGVGGDETDNSAPSAGAVYVFSRSGSVWSQQAYIKASNTDAKDFFGYKLVLSTDGTTLAVGSIQEASNATGIGGNQADNSAPSSGAVYVFTLSGATWSQEAYIKASNADPGDFFSWSLAVSADGNTLAVGSLGESSNATGVGGDQANDLAPYAGAVYLFTRSAAVWSQAAYVKASNTDPNDSFGSSVALSGDGKTLAVGADTERSNATGIGGNQADNSDPGAGAVYVYY